MVLFGSEEEITLSGDTTIRDHKRYHSGGLVKHLHINEESVEISDKKDIMAKVFDAYSKHERGEIVGWSVNAEIYDPQTLLCKRIIVRTVTEKRK